MEQMRVTVSWSPNGKRWLVELRAVTAEGTMYRTAVVEDDYGTPLLASTAIDCLDHVQALMGGQYPW